MHRLEEEGRVVRVEVDLRRFLHTARAHDSAWAHRLELVVDTCIILLRASLVSAAARTALRLAALTDELPSSEMDTIVGVVSTRATRAFAPSLESWLSLRSMCDSLGSRRPRRATCTTSHGQPQRERTNRGWCRRTDSVRAASSRSPLPARFSEVS